MKVKAYTMQSKKKSKKTSSSNKSKPIPFYIKMADIYLRAPLLFDLIIGLFIVVGNSSVVYFFGCLFIYKSSGIADTLNELISSTLSSGGFVLAALAILASIKQNIYNEDALKKENSSNKKSDDDALNERKKYFFNSSAYKNIINIYSYACLSFIILFLLFTILRNGIDYFSLNWIADFLIIGISILVLTLIRCIIILWVLIKS